MSSRSRFNSWSIWVWLRTCPSSENGVGGLLPEGVQQERVDPPLPLDSPFRGSEGDARPLPKALLGQGPQMTPSGALQDVDPLLLVGASRYHPQPDEPGDRDQPHTGSGGHRGRERELRDLSEGRRRDEPDPSTDQGANQPLQGEGPLRGVEKTVPAAHRRGMLLGGARRDLCQGQDGDPDVSCEPQRAASVR